MPIYSHTWSSSHGWHTKVTEDFNSGKQIWIHSRKLSSYVAFTVNVDTYYRLEKLLPEERIKLFESECEENQVPDKFICYLAYNQFDSIIRWNSENELNYYLSSQLTDIERFIFKEKRETNEKENKNYT